MKANADHKTVARPFRLLLIPALLAVLALSITPPQGTAAFMTQDFGPQTDSTALIVGVAHNDTNGNSFYDRGEGLAGVQIMPDAGTYYAVTSSSAGYAIPVTAGSLLTVVASGGALPGPMERTVDVSQSGDNVKLDFVANTLPVASALSIIPASPLTTDNLVASYTYSDADGDPESGSDIIWYKDSVLQVAHNGLLTVPSSATSKGEAWYFTVIPSDGTDYGIPQTSASVTIGNSAPTVSDLSITPASPSTTDHLLGSYTYGDADADPESGSEIRWYKDAVLQTTYNDLLTIPSSVTSKGEQWYFTVTPNDGASFGQLQTSASVTIGDTVPVGGEAYPVNTISVLAPWIAAAALLAGGAGWYALRRRGTQS